MLKSSTLPLCYVSFGFHFRLYVIGKFGEKVDARDAFDLVNGVHVVAFGIVCGFVLIDKTDCFWLIGVAKHYLKERFWHCYTVSPNGFVLAL